MHMSAVILLGVAGCLFCIGAVVYWLRIARQSAVSDNVSMVIVGFAMTTLTGSLVLSIIDHRQPEFTYAVLSTWSAVAAMLFIKRFLSMPSRSLLMVPMGAMAVMVAIVAVMDLPEAAQERSGSLPFVTIIHILFMSLFLGASLVSGAAGFTYFLADRQLRSASERAFKLPSLPSLRRVCFTGLVFACALLCGGLATGAAATTYVEAFDYLHPIVIVSVLNMLLLLSVLFMDMTRGINQKFLSTVSIILLLLAILSVISLNLQSPYA